MMLRCTKRLLDVAKPGYVADAPASDDDWYANLLPIDGFNCLLLTHAGTLFTIFEPDVRPAQLRDIGRLAIHLIGRELAREQLPPETFGNLDPDAVLLSKTADRSIRGCMNDMASMCRHAADRAGGLPRLDNGEINSRLRRNINSPRGYQQPIDLTVQRIVQTGLPDPGQSRR